MKQKAVMGRKLPQESPGKPPTAPPEFIVHQGLFVTTSLSPRREDERKAIQLAEELHSVYIPREKSSILSIKQRMNLSSYLMVWQSLLFYFTAEGEKIFFHPGLAKKRILALQHGSTDWMISALQLAPGDRVVDANLGLAQDALVIAYCTRAPVLGIEIHSIIARIAQEGLLHYPWEKNFPQGKDLAPLIQVYCADNREVLKQLGTRSFDCVYFSPMFIQPKKFCPDRMGLRQVAPKDFPDEETIREALRVAKKSVAMKVNRDRPKDFPIPTPSAIIGGRRSYVQYLIYQPNKP